MTDAHLAAATAARATRESDATNRRFRLAIVVSHPIQYYAPWFAHLSRYSGGEIRVFYLWDFGVAEQSDPTFQRPIKWDISLLDGYAHEFVPNAARTPGTDRFHGLDNPTLPSRLRAWRPDAILVFGYGWKTMLRLAWTWRGAPLILRGDNHDLCPPSTHRVRPWLRNLFLRRLFRRYQAFACVGKANRRFYSNRGVGAERLFHVPHAIDNQRFAKSTEADARAWRARHGFASDQLLLLFAGKLEPKKRPDLLVSAFLEARVPNASLALVGTGALASSIDLAVGSATMIKRLGFINQTEMPIALSAADLLVLPSQGPGETWGLIVNEAMACGTPAIVSDHVGCAEDLITDGETGWVFPAGDQAALARVLALAAETVRSDSQRLETAARDRVARYSYDAATEGLRRLLQSVAVRPTADRSP